jgi:hypothetical protein
MLSARFMVAIAILLTVRAAVAAQGQLVIATENTKQYHRPSCSIIRDGKQKDIVAMNVGQAKLRGYKPHPACHSDDSANSTSPVTGQSGGEQPRPVFVYTAPNDTRYHKENCARLGKERKKVALEEAGRKLWPCSLCRPPVRKRAPAIPRR